MFEPADPDMMKWDLVKALLLLFTALFTPYEIAFLETRMNFYFVVNRIVDLGFGLDIFVNFNLAFYAQDGNMIKKKSLVRMH